MTENDIAKKVLDVALRVHRGLGPGLLESVYETVMAVTLGKDGLSVVTQRNVPIVFEGTRFEAGFRADLIVEDKVIVEIKSVATILAVHHKQLLTYLKLADKRLGLLLNFNVALMKHGMHRVVDGLKEQT